MAPSKLFYKRDDGWFGDVMPIYADGVFHLFYTFLAAADAGADDRLKALEWAHVVTPDFVTFTELPPAIPHGGLDDADLLAGAGSVVAVDGGYVAFYCGINDRRIGLGEPEQVVLRATSPDLLTWTKDPDFEFRADPRWYEPDSWRDPAVLRDRDGWRMLLCARQPVGPHDRRGCIGSARSTDLRTWTAEAPLLAPGTTFAPECPDVFGLGGRRYLSYSTYSDRFASRYRIWDDAAGWVEPADASFDSNDVYAVKSVSDGSRRYAIGWLASRAGDSDRGHRQWGGRLVTHELIARADGTLGVAPPAELLAQFRPRPTRPEPRVGAWTDSEAGIGYDGPGFGWAAAGLVGGSSYFETTLDLSSTAEEVGVAVRASDDFGSAYLLRVEPRAGRVTFDRRPHRIDVPFRHDTDRSYVGAPDHEIARVLPVADTARIRVFVEGSVIVAYVNDVAISTRGYDLVGGEFGLYAAAGTARFSQVMHGGRVDAGQDDVLAASNAWTHG